MKVMEEDKYRKEEETFSWFVAWQALQRMTYHAVSQELIDKMVLLWKTVFVQNFHLYFSKLEPHISRHDHNISVILFLDA